jgi:hypothetical protein
MQSKVPESRIVFVTQHDSPLIAKGRRTTGILSLAPCCASQVEPVRFFRSGQQTSDSGLLSGQTVACTGSHKLGGGLILANS